MVALLSVVGPSSLSSSVLLIFPGLSALLLLCLGLVAFLLLIPFRLLALWTFLFLGFVEAVDVALKQIDAWLGFFLLLIIGE